MKNKCLSVILVCLLMVIIVCHSHAQKALSNEISISIPQNVITNMINVALPLNLEKGPYLKGALWIHTIDGLKIVPNRVEFDMNVRGKDIKFETRLGNQALLMDIGNLHADFSCKVSIRYDAPKRLLYLTPYLLQKPGKNLSANLLQLLSLSNGVEYAIKIQKFQPIITKLCSDQFSIDMDITHIYTENGKIFITGQPKIKKIPPAS